MAALVLVLCSIPTEWVLAACFAFSVCATLMHACQEIFSADGPLWDHFGRIAGVAVPWPLGLAAFSVLAVGLIEVAWLGYLDRSAVALSLLFGARLGDSWFSHLDLRIKRLSVPNPGLPSVPLYGIECVGIAVAVPEALLLPWVLIGAGTFALVIPALSLAGWIARRWAV
ncbi:MAG TPA: hypothetical protein VGE74_12930 [Gemmata sp.]